jgi:hypothetical protein
MRTVTLFSIGLWLCTVAVTTAGEDQQLRAASKAVPTAWGKPVNGLQAGIRIRSSDPGPDAILELSIVIRNVGQKEAELYQSLALYFWGGERRRGRCRATRIRLRRLRATQRLLCQYPQAGSGMRTLRPADYRTPFGRTRTGPPDKAGPRHVSGGSRSVRVAGGRAEDHRTGYGLLGRGSPTREEVSCWQA